MMGAFRRISLVKLYALCCTFFILYILASSFQPHVLEEVNRLQRELRKAREEVAHLRAENSRARHLAKETENENAATIYLITPTYPRHTQKADLTRLLYTLMHIRNLHWIIVEDAEDKTQLVSDFIARIPASIGTSHLVQKTPHFDKLAEDDPNWLKPRGVQQRNAALGHLVAQFSDDTRGLVYFMDDDNTYTIELFDEIRKIREGEVGVWPVGIVGKLRYEGPVCSNGEIVKWFTAWKPDRPFPLDMAGFALHLQEFVSKPEAQFKQRVPRGYQESHILTSLGLSRQNARGLANDCRDVLVWHTRTEKPRMDAEDALLKKFGVASDITIEI